MDHVVSALDDLRQAENIYHLAELTGFKAKSISYLIYVLPIKERYNIFEVAKKSGGIRRIAAPDGRLKLLQKRIAALLYKCQEEALLLRKDRDSVSHGFEKECSILTNAWPHKKKRFVLNIDLQDFFPSINFGRVRGYFLKDRDFMLREKVATILAQIACINNELPQGSPCSPVISNLVARILDVRLARFAKEARCHYTRYADDITFSTNERAFPSILASESPINSGVWALGHQLISIIDRSGFKINTEKTRMQCRPSQQSVTGLVVNERVNVKSLYYRTARAKCHLLFQNGSYFVETSPKDDLEKTLIQETAHLEGVLAHIYHVKHYSDERSGRLASAKVIKDNKVVYPAYRELYKKFLYFKRFINLDKPIIVCEGKTDNIYLRSALRNLAKLYPSLVETEGSDIKTLVRFLKHGGTEHDILELSGGSAKLAAFVGRYAKSMQNYKFRPLKFPVIVLIDNDLGATEVFKATKDLCKPKPSLTTKNDFYFVCYNLYIVKTHELGDTAMSSMEDYFDPELLEKKLEGKSFSRDNDLDNAHHYGKFAFADRVVRPAVASSDFSRFCSLFNRITAVIDDYATKTKPSS